MSYYNYKCNEGIFTSALLVHPYNSSNNDHNNTHHSSSSSDSQSQPHSRSHSIESTSMANCLNKDLLRRLNSISPLEKRLKGPSDDSLSPSLSQDPGIETEFQLVTLDTNTNDLSSKEYAAMKHFGTNVNQSKISNKKKQRKGKRNSNMNEEYITEMFGRRGWICEQCHNFNYETRIKCNRCSLPKKAKRLLIPPQDKQQQQQIVMTLKKQMDTNRSSNSSIGKSISHPQYDWVCSNCFNLNYSFRQTCNRCQLNNSH